MSTNKDKKKTKFVYQPEYPGGPKEMTKFLYENLRYPALAAASNIEGTVLVEFDIDYLGKVVATRVIQGLGHGCDEEAARLVRLLRFDVPKNREFKVLFHQKARIKFVKPKAVMPSTAPAAPVNMQIQYQFVPNTDTQAESVPGLVYHYTITI
jgi:TonB family protein